MYDKNLDFLFTEFGTSGREHAIAKKIEKHISKFVDSIEYDVMGSLIAFKKGTGPSKEKKKVMIAAHMDGIGFVVSHIDDNGFARFCAVGGQNPYYLISKRVVFENGIQGTIQIEGKEASKKNISIDKMFVDIGANSKKEAEAMISIGEFFFIKNKPIVQNNKLMSAFLDDRIGCYVAVKAIEELKKTFHDVYFVFTTQEEVGCRGSKTAAYKISPDYGFAIDVTLANDTPGEALLSSAVFGKGTAIKVKDNGLIVSKQIINHMVSLCEKAKIKYQKEVLNLGATDAAIINLTKEGIPAGCISIPTRYVHSANEMCDMNDVEESIKLVKELVNKEY